MARSKAKSKTIPVPLGGWNARDPLESMPDTDAIRLINMFPRQGEMMLRKGYRVHTPSGMGTGPVETLAEYSGADGSRKLIAAANGNIFDASTLAAGATDLSGGFAAFSNNRWQTAMYKNHLILVNGQDEPKKFDGTTLADAVYTGIAAPEFLVTVAVYKQRLYFIEQNTLSVWYGAAGNITGALTELPVSDFCQRGGHLMFAGSYTRDTGEGFQDLFILITNMGECLVYGGLHPEAEDWNLVARYYLAPPLSRRSFYNYNADLVVLTTMGAVPLSRVLSGLDPESDEAFISDKIREAYRQSAKLYRDNFGWDACVYPEGALIYTNVPTGSATFEQYAVNIYTGAWTRFIGMNAVSWSRFSEGIYFGGTDGKIYEADYGTTDNGSDIRFEQKPAFNYFGDRSSEKMFSMVRPIIRSEDALRINCNVDVDYRDRTYTDEIVTAEGAGSEWDEDEWNEGEWAGGNVITDDWYGVGDYGRCASLKMSGLARNVSFSISAIDVIYETGGFI